MHYKKDLDRYVADSILQPHDPRTDYLIFIDQKFKKSGYLQFQSLMDQLYNSFVKFSRSTLPLYRFLECQGSAMELRNTETRAVQEELLKEIKTEIQKDDAKQLLIISQEEEALEEIEDPRWWLGYELEKKLAAQRNIDLKTADLREKSHALDENEIIESILKKYNKSKHFKLLVDILKPHNGNKLKILNWKDQVMPLLIALKATVNQKCNGSRNKVILNGNKTVFHTHGEIGIDTINSHLRGYLIQSLCSLNVINF